MDGDIDGEEGGILAGSGDGGLIDHDDDDDHTGDDDDDDERDIIRHHQHGLDSGAIPSKPDDDHKPVFGSKDDDVYEEEDIDVGQPIDNVHTNEDDEDIDNKSDSEDGTEIYTDITDETSAGSSSTTTTEKRRQCISVFFYLLFIVICLIFTFIPLFLFVLFVSFCISLVFSLFLYCFVFCLYPKETEFKIRWKRGDQKGRDKAYDVLKRNII